MILLFEVNIILMPFFLDNKGLFKEEACPKVCKGNVSD